MSGQGAWNADRPDYFLLKVPAAAVARNLWRSGRAVAVGETDDADVDELPAPEALVLSLQRREHAAKEIRVGARAVPVVPFPFGTMSLINLALDATGYETEPSDHVSLYLGRAVFDRLADENGASRISTLAIEPGVAADDPLVANLGACLEQALEPQDKANALFVDHVVLALHTHLAQRYGGMAAGRPPSTGGLAPWQLRRVRDMIDANLEGEISLARLAGDCGLSVSHFTRAFSRSTGMPPHRWLIQRRLEHAKRLMRTTRDPLAEIALQCGFSDQSHFTRSFAAAIGTTPGRWRVAERA
jgi:AraC family transcriptional regulator